MIKTPRPHRVVLWCLLTALVLPPFAAASERTETGVRGRVMDDASPIHAAAVFAYEVASTKMTRVQTDRAGQFLFHKLPAGMYKLVAFKPGFQPAVELLLRRTPRDLQFVDLELERQTASATHDHDDYWTVRGRVPVDILRQLTEFPAESMLAQGVQLSESELFSARMQAQSGVESYGAMGQAQMTGAEIGVRGAVGKVEVGLKGNFRELQPEAESLTRGAQSQSMALEFDAADQHQIRVATSHGKIDSEGPGSDAVDLRHYQVEWAGEVAEGDSRVAARYLRENNYYGSHDQPTPVSLPSRSQLWDIEGSYARALSGSMTLRSGARYRQLSTIDDFSLDEGQIEDEALSLFSVIDAQLKPRVLVEYGLYSSVRDGSMSLMPHGGMVVELGADWQARAAFANRIEAEEDNVLPARGFSTAFYRDDNACREVGDACYEVSFTRASNDENRTTIGALHREYAETLRLYFSPDFFNRLESLFVVEGDTLPELQFEMVRRITPRILARLESNLAEGGGGIFYATNAQPYENQVRYLVTSLDTRFQRTSTGVFIAFHHLQQALQAIDDHGQQGDSSSVEMERLQLMLTQDLGALADLTANWAVRLNMELSRGSTPYTLTVSDETYRKLTGGLSVSF